MMKLKQKLIRGILLFAFALVIANPTFVFAQSNNNSTGGIGLTNYSGVDSSISKYLCTPSDPSTPDNSQDLPRCINKVYRFGVAFGAIAVVFFIVLAGYMYITGGEAAKGKAKTMIQNAVIGIGLMLGSYVILSFINPTLVIYKPIQPPIFIASDLADCAQLGLGEECVLPDGSTGLSNGSGGGTKYAPCPGGQLVSVTGVSTDGGVGQICKALLEKIVQLKANTKDIPWLATSAVDGTHISQCHKSGNAYSGTCVDLALNGGRSPSYTKESGSTNPKWGDLCKAIYSLGGVAIANEASKNSSCSPYKVYDTTTGPNLHIYLSQ